MSRAEYARIALLRDEAAAHGDLDQVVLCDAALAGSTEARDACLRALQDATDQDDEATVRS